MKANDVDEFLGRGYDVPDDVVKRGSNESAACLTVLAVVLVVGTLALVIWRLLAW
jgi:hypothetical protein